MSTSKRGDKFQCPVCYGDGKVEVHEGHLPWLIDCENCGGNGYCDWIRYASPIPFHLWDEVPK